MFVRKIKKRDEGKMGGEARETKRERGKDRARERKSK
jgi:hypothetical protein